MSVYTSGGGALSDDLTLLLEEEVQQRVYYQGLERRVESKVVSTEKWVELVSPKIHYESERANVAMDMCQVAKDALLSMRDDYDDGTEKKRIEHLTDGMLLRVFSFLPHRELFNLALVCRRWRNLAYDGHLWDTVSFRPDKGGLRVTNIDTLVQLIGLRFGPHLRYLELPFELVVAEVLHELANKCPNLRYVTLDFSNAMQLHEYSDLYAFPNNLYSLCICLSEVIFMEGFMRRIYHCLGSLQVLHLIGTFELSDEKEEEIYEVINISKIRSHTPNLRVVNLYGINFIEDTHIELLAGNCIHLECLAVNFCLRVKGRSFKTLFTKCKKLRSLLLHHCELDEAAMVQTPWENSVIDELDLSSCELSTACLMDIFSRIHGFRYLGVAHSDTFSDKVLEMLMARGKLDNLVAIDVSHTPFLSDDCLFKFCVKFGPKLHGLNTAGKPLLGENFWIKTFVFLTNIKILILGTAYGWFLGLQSKIHVDQIVDQMAIACPSMERVEFRWDPDTLKYSEKSGKSIDHLRIRCTKMKSFTLADCAYYEMVKSNFERTERMKIVRTTTNYHTRLTPLLTHFKDLRFN